MEALLRGAGQASPGWIAHGKLDVGRSLAARRWAAGDTMELAIPHLRILDYDGAVAFYVDALGFEIDFEWRNEPGLPVYMGIRRGTLYAHLSEYEASGPPGQGRGMVLSVDDAERWYKALKQKGVPIEREIQTQPWGARDFILRDPFDNTIVVMSSSSQ